MKSFKSKELIITFSALTICCAVLALGLSIAFKIQEAQVNWNKATETDTHATAALGKIQNHLGYGGTLYKFRNALLHQQYSELSSLEGSFSKFKQSIHYYQQFAGSPAEVDALALLNDVASQYQTKFELIHTQVQQENTLNQSSQQLLIEDKPAIQAIALLESSLAIRRNSIKSMTDASFSNVVNQLTLGVLIIPAIVLFAIALVVFLRKLTSINQRLNDTHRSLDALFEAVPDAIITANQRGQLLRVNKQALDLFGYSQQEFSELNIEALMPDRFRQAHTSYRDSYFKQPSPRAMENSNTLHIINKSGDEIPVEISLSNTKENGEYIAVATIRDISVRKEQESIIQASQTRLAEAQRIAKLGSWSINFKTGETIWSNEVYTILKLDKSQTTPSLELYLSSSCDSEKDELRQVISSLKHSENRYNIIRKLCLSANEHRFVREEGEVQRDENGKITHALGTIRDITEAVHTREKLEQAAVVFEHTSDAVLITDKEHRIIAVNNAFCSITGYSENESLGKDAGFTKSGQHKHSFYRDMTLALDQEGSWQGEIWDRRKDGEIYPKWLSINSVYNDRGNLLYYVGVFSDISHIKSTEDKLRHLALHDSLTGLPNRLSFNEHLDRVIKHADRNRLNSAVLFLDLDRFKTINDSLGHPVGDALLIEVATRLKACLRNEDTIARLGGDEFTIIMEDILIPEDAAKVAEKIIRSLSAPVEIDDHQFYATTSIGISLYPKDGTNVTELVKNADAAMYRAKESGRNCYEFYSSELATTAVARLELEGELRKAIDNKDFILHYQPQFNLKTEEITGAEALIRWTHPDRGLIYPDEFIPLAEETGLINQIGEIALRKACQQLKLWHSKGWMIPKISVNVAGQQIHNGQFLPLIKETLSITNIHPSSIEIELTETTLMHNTEETIKALSQLKSMGVTISIDDFGTGYSSLSYLKTLPIQRIKIDRSFVQDLPSDTNDIAITRAIIALSSALDLDVIAEGVETQEQLQFLMSEHCIQAQGYLFSEPLPAKQLFEKYEHATHQAFNNAGSTKKTYLGETPNHNLLN